MGKKKLRKRQQQAAANAADTSTPAAAGMLEVISARRGDEAGVLRCLAEGVEPPQLRQAFGVACLFGDEPIARLLLQKAECVRLKCPNLRDDPAGTIVHSGGSIITGLTPLCAACVEGHEAVVRLLVEHSCDIDSVATPTIQNIGGSFETRRHTALYVACRNGHLQAAKVLVGAGCNVEAQMIDHSSKRIASSPLAECAFQTGEGREKIAQLLINAGADLEAKSRYPAAGKSGSAVNATALYFACEAGHEAMVRLLLDAGSDINTTSTVSQNAEAVRCERNLFELSNHTALYIACQNNHVAIVRLLLDAGADIEAGADGESQHFTPLHRACYHLPGTDGGCETIQLEMVQLLIEKGANVKATSHKGHTPLHLASSWNVVIEDKTGRLSYTGEGMIRLLLQAGADLETPEDKGFRPLHTASFGGDKHAVRALLEAGASTGVTTNSDCAISNCTALHLACLCLHPANRQAVVSLLLEAGCEMNAQDSFGYTPLHIACRGNHSNCARLLVSAGCDTTLHNNDGETALETAEHNGHEELVQELRPLIKAANKKRRKNAQKARRRQQQAAAAATATAAVAAAAAADASPEPELEGMRAS